MLVIVILEGPVRDRDALEVRANQAKYTRKVTVVLAQRSVDPAEFNEPREQNEGGAVNRECAHGSGRKSRIFLDSVAPLPKVTDMR